MTPRRAIAAAVAGAVVLVVAGCSSSPEDMGGSQTITVTKTAALSASKPAASPSPSPSPSCTLADDQDLIVRDDDPQASIIASEIGEADLGNCTTTLSSFAETAGQAEGECTTIAWARDNPGYDVDTVPAPPLKHVIESAGPGC